MISFGSSRAGGTVRREGQIQVGRASLFVVGALIPLAANFALLPFLWHKLSPEDYGILAIAEMQAALFGIFWGLSLEAALARSYFEWPVAERPAKVGTLWLANWGLVLGFGGVSLVISALLSELVFQRIAFFPLVFLGLSYAILQRLRLIIQATLRVMGKPVLFLAFSLGSVAISVTMVVWLVFGQDRGLLGYLLAINVAEAIVALVSMQIMIRLSKVVFSVATCREALSYSLPLIPAALVGSAATLIDRFLVERFLGLGGLGIYALCQRFSGLLDSVNDALKMSYAPYAFRMVSEQVAGFREAIAATRIRYYAIIAFGALLLGMFISDYVKLTDRADYSAVADYLPWLLLATLFNLSYPYFGSGLLFAKRTDLVWVPMALQTAGIVFFGFMLIPDAGMVGAMATKILAAMLFSISAGYLAHRCFYLPINYWGLLLILAVFGLNVYVIPQFTSNITTKIVSVLSAIAVLSLVLLKNADCKPKVSAE